MKNKKRKSPVRQKTGRPAGPQRPSGWEADRTSWRRGSPKAAAALLVLQNAFCRVALWPEMGGAITSYVDRDTGVDIIWRNPYGQPARTRVVDQPMARGSDLYDVMDGSWYVSLPAGFFPGDYFGAPIGTHGELRALPWAVESIERTETGLAVTLVGKSVRTPLVYRRTLTLGRNDPLMRWTETVENRSRSPLPVAWLQHPTFGGPCSRRCKIRHAGAHRARVSRRMTTAVAAAAGRLCGRLATRARARGWRDAGLQRRAAGREREGSFRATDGFRRRLGLHLE